MLWAANLGENGVVFPAVSCRQPVFMSDCVLDFVSLLPSTSVTGPTARGVQSIYGGFEGRVMGWGIHHQPLALGLRTRGYQQTV